VLACVPLAIAVGSVMPWLDAEKVGPLRPWDYLYALFVFGLPTLLITAAGFFALATATRSMMWTYVGAVAALVLFSVARVWTRDLQYDTFTALSDPFALSALSITTKYWTAADRNTMLPPLSGLLLANRVLWLAIAAVLFGIAWRSFRFEVRAGGHAARPAEVAAPQAAAPAAALANPRADAATRRIVIDLVRRAKPDVVITHSPDDYVSDHTATSRLVCDASFYASAPLVKTDRPCHSKIPPVFFMDTVAGVNFLPTEYVDISDTFAEKREMILQHRSQFDWLSGHDHIDMVELAEVSARSRGLQCGVRYAEAFRPYQVWGRQQPRRLLP